VIAGVKPVTETDSNDNTTTVFRPTIVYEYIVGDQTYRSDRVGFTGRRYTASSQAESFLHLYIISDTVIVYYNPNDPQRAVLDRTPPPAGAIPVLLCILGVAILLGLGMLIAAFRPARRWRQLN
jgi:Protein of unknown function (DUF3592)